jgi:hypothetical protein
MRKSSDSRRVIALIAAYVVVLQALLLPLSVAAGASIDPTVCARDSTAHGSQPPASHDTGCGCAAGCGMQCCGQALASPPQSVIALALTSGCAMAPLPRVIEPNVRTAERSPQVPRAPPAA